MTCVSLNIWSIMQYRKSEIEFSLFDKNFTGIVADWVTCVAELYTLELGFVPFKKPNQPDRFVSRQYVLLTLHFSIEITEIDAAKVRTYEGFMISLAILILRHCESGHCHLHYNVLHTRNKLHKLSKEHLYRHWKKCNCPSNSATTSGRSRRCNSSSGSGLDLALTSRTGDIMRARVSV